PPRHRTPTPTRFPYTTLFRSLHDADHPRDEPRRDARADRRAARQRIRARHVRIDAPVEVAHRAELALEEDRGVARESVLDERERDRKSTRLNSSHGSISYAVF